MSSRYTLMNKNTPLAKLDITLNRVYITQVINEIPEYIGDINYWIDSRFELFGRDNLIKMAKLAGISNQQEYVTITKAISINDTFWINDNLNPTTWDKINPYTNRLSRIMADIAINGIDLYRNQHLASPSPQYRLDGQTDKCVKRVNGVLTIYKTDGERWSDLAGCRPYSEYFASKTAKAIGITNYVNYDIDEYKTNNGFIKPYCNCKIFTSEKYGLVQAAYAKLGALSLDELAYILPKSEALKLKNMAVLDSIILNIDRHKGNYGFLYDTDTFRIISLAPIYDNDCSLGSTVSIQNKTYDEAYNEIVNTRLPKLWNWTYNEQALWGMTDSMYKHLKQLGKAHFRKTNTVQGLSERRVEFINYIINRRIQEILKL